MHTKGKWTLQFRQGREGLYEEIMQQRFFICGPRHTSHFVADIAVASTPEGAANARRICRCVNSHDALLGACKDLWRVLDSLNFGKRLSVANRQILIETHGVLRDIAAESED